MADYVSRDLARGKCQTPSYKPYISVVVSVPWHVPSDEHTAAIAKWASNKQAPKPGDQQLPFHTWVLYRLRLMIAADLRAAWLPFGGLAAHLGNISIILQSVTTESIAVALHTTRYFPPTWRN